LDKKFSLYFVVEKEESRKIYATLPEQYKASITKSFTGYGLANIHGQWNFSLDFLSPDQTVYEALIANKHSEKLTNASGRTAATCKSGGTGSTSCSIIGECSVSCTSGY
jgi:hypothetical protein